MISYQIKPLFIKNHFKYYNNPPVLFSIRLKPTLMSIYILKKIKKYCKLYNISLFITFFKVTLNFMLIFYNFCYNI